MIMVNALRITGMNKSLIYLFDIQNSFLTLQNSQFQNAKFLNFMNCLSSNISVSNIIFVNIEFAGLNPSFVFSNDIPAYSSWESLYFKNIDFVSGCVLFTGIHKDLSLDSISFFNVSANKTLMNFFNIEMTIMFFKTYLIFDTIKLGIHFLFLLN